MSPGRPDARVVDRHLIAMRKALATLRRHAGASPVSLGADAERRWAIERGLQLCAQNAPARISHQVTAADADLTAFAALNAARVPRVPLASQARSVLSSTPARPDSRSPCQCSHLRALASRPGEKCGLDIASHVSSAAGLDPGSYRSSIDCLVEAGALPRTFGERFRGIAGFRNVLVHGYLEIDLELLARMLSERLDDFEEFATHIEHWLARETDA